MESDPFEEWAAALALWAPPEPQREAPPAGADGWAASAKWFRAMRESFDAGKDPFLTFLTPWLTEDAVVADIGAGAGRLSLPIAARVRKVIAVEASPAMREALKEGLESGGITNVEVVGGRWPEAEIEGVDVALCANVLYDVANLRAFLTKFDQIARRACFIYLTARHPYTSFRDLWQEFRGWAIPDKPTYADAVRCLKRLGIEPEVEAMAAQPGMAFADIEQGVAFARRRLGLPDEPEVIGRLRDYLRYRGVQKDDRWEPGWEPSQGIVLRWDKA